MKDEKKNLLIQEGKSATFHCPLLNQSFSKNNSLIWIKNGKSFNFYHNSRFESFNDGTLVIKNATMKVFINAKLKRLMFFINHLSLFI